MIDIELPKWPALTVCGERVTEYQAAEILIRTDQHAPLFEYAGNDEGYADQVASLFNGISIESLNLEYLENSMIISSWIGGPHGWCDWDGNVFSNNYNIGKWPSVSEITNEWETIAKAFPYLKLRSQLYDAEVGEKTGKPIVEFIVSRGKVRIIEPTSEIVPRKGISVADISSRIFNPYAERGIDIETLLDKIEMIYGGRDA